MEYDKLKGLFEEFIDNIDSWAESDDSEMIDKNLSAIKEIIQPDREAKEAIVKAVKEVWANKVWIEMEEEEDGNGCIISGKPLDNLKNALKNIGEVYDLYFVFRQLAQAS